MNYGCRNIKTDRCFPGGAWPDTGNSSPGTAYAVPKDSIAADSGISRKTFYNNDLLRLYVEKYAYDPEEASSSAELQRLRARIDQYKKQIDAFLLRDVETENLRHENMTLNNEISNLQKHNKNLEEQYAVILKEVQKLRSQLAVQPGHIIELPSSK